MILAKKILIGPGRTQLTPPPDTIVNVDGLSIAIKNMDLVNSVFWGGALVDTIDGYELVAEDEISIDVRRNQELFITASSPTYIKVAWVD